MKLHCILCVGLTFTPLAFANVIVDTPADGTGVTSPFTLSAHASSCSSQPVLSMGYSIDSGEDLTIVKVPYIKVEVITSAGEHTLHVKAWGTKGSVCVTDVTIKVTAADSIVSPPSYAITLKNLQAFGHWKSAHDSGTRGSSDGLTSLAGSPSRTGVSRKFETHYSAKAGERFYMTFGDDTESENFLYDAWLYIAGSSSTIAALEMDINQVMENGETVIFGFQCDGWWNTWEYTGNIGTPAQNKDRWIRTRYECNPRSWTTNTWHHIQISYSRDSTGVVTYKSVTFDGVTHIVNGKILSAFELGWGPTLMTNFQVDGWHTAGKCTIYMDELDIYRW